MDTDTLSFRALRLHDWRQFGSIELLFHERLTVITGANAAGKTTLLDLLASHFGWNHQFVGTPARRKRGRPLSFLSGLWRRESLSDQQTAAEIGGIEYSNGEMCTLRVPDQLAGPAFNISYDGQQGVSGMFIPSHRPAFSYTAVNQIPTDLGGRAEIGFVCSECNRRKGDYFDENETIVNPFVEDPETFLLFAGAIVAERPGSRRGIVTIKKLDLGRGELVERRTELLRRAQSLINTWAGMPAGPAREAVAEEIRAMGLDSSEYAAAARSYLRLTGPDAMTEGEPLAAAD